MKYKYLWFDLGMTLVETSRSIYYQNVLQKFEIAKTEEEIKKAYHITDKIFMREYPHVISQKSEEFLPWYLGVLNYKLGVQLNIFDCYDLLKEQKRIEEEPWHCIPHVKETLDLLKQKGFHLGLISNWDSTCRKVLKDNGLDQWLERIIISSEVGIEKPDSRIFTSALQCSGATSDCSLYIGDNYYDDVIGASKVGMDSVLVNPYGSLGIEEIKGVKIIPDISKLQELLESGENS